MLNWIWALFFVVAFIAAVVQAVVYGRTDVFKDVVGALFDSAKTAFEISIGLTGVMSLWLGLMRIAEQGGVTELIARLVGPLFRRLFPSVPDGHPAIGAIVMNRSANMLGLDNAATPLGLKAMKELQGLNPDPDRASNDMILFMVLNASSVTLVPISILTFRAQLHAANPADVYVPILIATFIADLSGLLIVAAVQKLSLWNGVVLAWVGSLTLAIAGLKGPEIGQGTGLNNMMRQLGGSFGVAIITTIIHIRMGQNRNIMLEHIHNYNPAFLTRFNQMVQNFLAQGVSLTQAQQMAYGSMEGVVTRQTMLTTF